MKSTKTIFLGLLAVLGFQSNVFAQESGLSFSQAQDLMKGNNKQFQINQKKLETSQFNEKASKALSYPKFNAFAAATWMDKDIALDLNDKRAQVAGLLQIPNPSILGNWNFTLQENDVQMVGLGVTWLISPFFVSSNLLPLNYYQDLASNNLPQIEKLKLLEQLSEQKIKAEKANHLLSVAVFGQKILASNNLPLDNPLFLGVGVKYDLFDGFATKNNVRAAESEKSTLELARKKRNLISKLW